MNVITHSNVNRLDTEVDNLAQCSTSPQLPARSLAFPAGKPNFSLAMLRREASRLLRFATRQKVQSCENLAASERGCNHRALALPVVCRRSTPLALLSTLALKSRAPALSSFYAHFTPFATFTPGLHCACALHALRLPTRLPAAIFGATFERPKR